MDTRTLLRLEGLVVGVGATAAFFLAGGAPLSFLVVVLLPDLSMAGYLIDGTWGSRTYNAVHTYALPVAALVAGYWAGAGLVTGIALVWIAHIGGDRALGYGLKYRDADFSTTHIQRS